MAMNDKVQSTGRAEPAVPASRRRFLKDAAGVAGGAGLLALGAGMYAKQASALPATAIRPPGALPEDDFLAACVRCGLCVRDCPYKTLKLAELGDGVATGTPYFEARDIPCEMCEDIPCVKACPTGALKFGDKTDMLKLAYKRAKELGGDASVYGDKYVDGTHVLYVLPEKVSVYEKLPLKPSVPLSIIVWKDLLKPLSLLAAGGVIAGSFLHYIIHGPKLPDEDQNQKGGE